MVFSIRSKILFLLTVIPVFAGAQNKIPEKDTNSYLRMDINAIPDRIVLRGQKQTDAHIYNAGWYREDSRFVLTMTAREPLNQEWTEYSVTFGIVSPSI